MECNKDCFNCIYADCINDEETNEPATDKLEKEVMFEERKLHAINNNTEKFFKYNNSIKGKAARKRYEQSEKGKETAKRKSIKRIASGKNAEYCRRYRQKKKAAAQAATLCDQKVAL